VVRSDFRHPAPHTDRAQLKIRVGKAKERRLDWLAALSRSLIGRKFMTLSTRKGERLTRKQ